MYSYVIFTLIRKWQSAAITVYNCSLVNVSGNINSEVCTAIERLAVIAALTTGGGAGSNVNTYV